ncbi:glycoside hydrolase [Mycena metata]|uniref:mannan endo-1,4-beta-mannosidase n=1 Tax=Mycena metata TaxID=1033252 RepID=A0AAD7P3M3_9AGAR|nr:glycoside hydrolase [Mycena metata]
MRRFLSVLPFVLGLFTIVSGETHLKRTVPKGFVTTRGAEFELDGSPFAFVGANSYWLPLLTSTEDVEATFQEMNRAGVKVLRTWGFNAINASELAGALESGLTYYQLWNNTDWTLNDGPQGLQRLDNVLEVALKYDIRGMELYINHITGAPTHDIFYTDPKIIASYQRYVKTIVNRYKSSAAIFAWEMMNEARCLGDLPAGPACVPGSGTLATWYKEQSDFIRSLDPHHLITTGGEGQFFWKTQDPDFPGSNFSVEAWGLFWIDAHANAAKKAGKPLILEEFGITGDANRTKIYPTWVNRALDTKHGGIMPWQFGMLGLKEDASPNDGLAIYKNQTVWNVFTNAAKVQATRSL